MTYTKPGLISVLIPDGDTYFSVKVLRCLSQVPEITAHILSRSKKTAAGFSRYCSSCRCHASANDDDWIGVIRNLVKELRLDVVLPATDEGFEFVVRNQKAISEFAAVPPLPNYDMFNMVGDKWSFYCFAKENGLPMPASVFIGKGGEPLHENKDIESIGYPAILKPTQLTGGFGFAEVSGPSDLARAWEDKKIIKGREYLLQSYVPGVEFSMNIYCKDGEVLTYTLQKSLLDPDHSFGPMKIMEFSDNQAVVELCSRVVSLTGWDGVGNVDFIIDDRNGGIVIHDFNPRFSQALLGSLSSGVNFPVLTCLDAVGMDLPDMRQTNVIYAHPVTHARMLAYRFMGRKTPTKIRFKDGGLKFVARDPLPELYDFYLRTVKWFARRI